MNRENYKGQHLLAEGVSISTNTWETRINNNVLVIGPSGARKTRGYVLPNLMNCRTESYVITDTKGPLYNALKESFKKDGYVVYRIDFTDLHGGCGYNPLDYIGYDPETDRFSEQDIMTLTQCIIPDTNSDDPYWEHASRQYLACLIGYVLEALPKEEHTLEYVLRVGRMLGDKRLDILMKELAALKPESTFPERYEAIKGVEGSPQTDSSIKSVLNTALDPLRFDGALALYRKPEKVDLTLFGRKKTVLFLTISDTDRSMDSLANALMTQILQQLCKSADHDFPDHCLDVPVRLYLDDFATNLYIPDFDKIISVIRSREIYVSIILQSITQLDALYGQAKARTIINNCDQMIYMGGQDLETAKYICERANKNLASVLGLLPGQGYLFIRGRKPRQITISNGSS